MGIEWCGEYMCYILIFAGPDGREQIERGSVDVGAIGAIATPVCKYSMSRKNALVEQLRAQVKQGSHRALVMSSRQLHPVMQPFEDT